MKKIVISSSIIIVIGFLVIFLLPTTKMVTQSVNVPCPIDALTRNIANPINWSMWWPGKKINDSSYSFNEKTIQISNILLNGLNGQTQSNGMQIQLSVQAVPIDSYTSQINISNDM